jgi:hypothetical protein
MQALGEFAPKKPRGGWRGHPNSIAALMRHQVPWEQQPKCRVCGNLAMRNTALCRKHIGRKVMQDRNGRPEQAQLRRLEYAGLLPFDLIELPVWRDLQALPTSVHAPIRLRLALLWAWRDKKPLAWAQAWRDAITAARDKAPSPIGSLYRDKAA